jgi:DNA ligase 1
VNYKFQELSRGGIPRFPSFGGERLDMSGPKDAVIPGVKD